MFIKDLYGKDIEVKEPSQSLKQLEVFIQLIDNDENFKNADPATIGYWFYLYMKLKAAIK